MSDLLRTGYAFLARDLAAMASYRFDVYLRLFSVLFLIVILYFASGLIGSNPSLDAYGGYLPYATLGVAVMNFFQVGFRSFATAIRNEQMMGTLEALFMTPARLPAIIMGSVIWNMILALLTVVAYLIIVVTFFDVRLHGNWLAASILMIMTSIVFCCFGVISASFILAFKRGDPIPFFAGTISALLGGVFFPVSLLPEWMQTLSQIVPVTYGLHGLREVLLRGAGWSEVMPDLQVLAVFIVLTLPICLACFSLALRRARREGSLLVY